MVIIMVHIHHINMEEMTKKLLNKIVIKIMGKENDFKYTYLF